MRRVGMMLAVALGVTVGACLDDELTLNSECLSSDDCVNDQTCIITPEQQDHDQNGWCRDDGGCAVGSQPGCECDGVSCSNAFDSSITIEAVHPDCVGEPDEMRETCKTETPAQVGACVCLITVQTG